MVWSRIKHGLAAIDDVLATYARIFGVGFVNPIPRYATFIFVYGAIYSVALYTNKPLALVAIWMGYIGVLAIGRAWTQNESFRSKIAKKLEDHDPDSLPDLRGVALLAVLQMIVLIPFLLETSHAVFGLYSVPEGADWPTWMAFGLDLLFRSFLDWSEVYSVHVSGVGLDSMGGRHLVMFILLSIDFMLIQGIIRIVGIQRTIEEGVAVAGKDPEMAFRLGRRATPRLSRMIMDADLELEVRLRCIEALGMIGDSGGAPQLVRALGQRNLHTRAIASLVMIGHFDSLFSGIKNPDPLVRRGCVAALGRLEDSVANEMLAEAIRDEDSSVRQHAHQAIGRIAHPSDVPLLAIGLRDENADVRFAALQQFSNFTGDEAMNTVLTAVNDKSDGVRRLAMEILARFPHAKVVPVLAKSLNDPNQEVREAAERSLKHLESLVDAGAV